MSINRVNISGNLTRDPELRATGSGMQILRFGVAVNDRARNQQTGEWEDRPNFVDCVVFGNRADALSRLLSKGFEGCHRGQASLQLLGDAGRPAQKQAGGRGRRGGVPLLEEPGRHRCSGTRPCLSAATSRSLLGSRRSCAPAPRCRPLRRGHPVLACLTLMTPHRLRDGASSFCIALGGLIYVPYVLDQNTYGTYSSLRMEERWLRLAW